MISSVSTGELAKPVVGMGTFFVESSCSERSLSRERAIETESFKQYEPVDWNWRATEQP